MKRELRTILKAVLDIVEPPKESFDALLKRMEQRK